MTYSLVGTPQRDGITSPFREHPVIEIPHPTFELIQSAFDVCNAVGGGKIYAGPGDVQMSTTFFTGSRTEFYGSGQSTAFWWTTALVGRPFFFNKNRSATACTGTASIDIGSKTVNGAGTRFLTELALNREISFTIAGKTFQATIESVTSDTVAVITLAWSYAAIVAQPFSIYYGDAGVVLADFRMEGEAGNLVDYQPNEQGIWISHGYDCSIRNVYANGIRNDAFVFEYCRDSAMERSYANHSLKVGFYLSGSDNCEIVDCHGYRNDLAGVTLGAAFYNTVRGGSYRYNGIVQPAAAGIFVARGSDHNVVTGTITDGINLDAGLVSNIDGGTTFFPHPDGGTYSASFSYGCSFNEISGNEIFADKTQAIRLTRGRGNNVHNNVIRWASSAGIISVGSQGNHLHHNQISNVGSGGVITAAILVTDDGTGIFSTDTILEGNNCFDDQGAPTSTGIFIQGGSARTRLRNNDVTTPVPITIVNTGDILLDVGNIFGLSLPNTVPVSGQENVFDLVIQNSGGIQHAFRTQLGTAVDPVHVASIPGAIGSAFTNTPFLTAAVGFAAGGGIDDASRSDFYFDVRDQLDTLNNDGHAELVSDNTLSGIRYTPEIMVAQKNFGGVTRWRYFVQLRNVATGATVPIDATSVPPATKIAIRISFRARR